MKQTFMRPLRIHALMAMPAFTALTTKGMVGGVESIISIRLRAPSAEWCEGTREVSFSSRNVLKPHITISRARLSQIGKREPHEKVRETRPRARWRRKSSILNLFGDREPSSLARVPPVISRPLELYPKSCWLALAVDVSVRFSGQTLTTRVGLICNRWWREVGSARILIAALQSLQHWTLASAPAYLNLVAAKVGKRVKARRLRQRPRENANTRPGGEVRAKRGVQAGALDSVSVPLTAGGRSGAHKRQAVSRRVLGDLQRNGDQLSSHALLTRFSKVLKLLLGMLRSHVQFSVP
eukprot:6177583-Pleurochrysis_carterae.AAC.2